MGARVAQRLDDVEELRNRARPAVRDDERQRVRFRRARVDEVHLRAVDVGEEVRPPVEPRFLRAPVELVPPRLAQVLEVREVGAVVPRRAGNLVGPPRAREPVAQVVEDLLRHLDAERTEVFGHGPNLSAYTAAAPPCAASITRRLNDEYQTIATTIAIGPHTKIDDDRQHDPQRLARAGTLERPVGVPRRVDRDEQAADERDDREQHDAEDDQQLRHAQVHASSLHEWPRIRSPRSGSTNASRSSRVRARGWVRGSHACLSAAGACVVLAARRAERLEAVASELP